LDKKILKEGVNLMKIGIIVHSQTGNTYSVAQKLQKKLSATENEVKVERITPNGEVNPSSKNIKFETLPDLDAYDALIFGAPVQAFSLSAVMKAYMNQIKSLNNKKVACFVTKGVPFNWTGGNKAINQMKKIIESQGGTVIGTSIVIWRDKREEQIAELVEKFSELF
jgi:flavodoxin